MDFVAAGMALALMVDPDEESVIVVRPDQTVRVIRGAERLDLDEVLPGFDLTADQLFSTLSLT